MLRTFDESSSRGVPLWCRGVTRPPSGRCFGRGGETAPQVTAKAPYESATASLVRRDPPANERRHEPVTHDKLSSSKCNNQVGRNTFVIKIWSRRRYCGCQAAGHGHYRPPVCWPDDRPPPCSWRPAAGHASPARPTSCWPCSTASPCFGGRSTTCSPPASTRSWWSRAPSSLARSHDRVSRTVAQPALGRGSGGSLQLGHRRGAPPGSRRRRRRARRPAVRPGRRRGGPSPPLRRRRRSSSPPTTAGAAQPGATAPLGVAAAAHRGRRGRAA